MSKRRIPPKIKESVYFRAKGRCEDCRCYPNKSGYWYWVRGNHDYRQFNVGLGFELHHVISLSKGGKNKIDNLVLLCEDCHFKRHGRKRRKPAWHPCIASF